MFTRRLLLLVKDPYWNRLSSFSVVLFFILLADAFLSFWVPNFLQDSLGSPLKMGLVMSFSSFIGFGADIVFPQILKNTSVKRLLVSAMLVSLVFITCLAIGVAFPTLLIFLIAMGIWGIYYEYLHFAQQQFIADTTSIKLRSASWGILGVFKNLAYFLGPILSGALLINGEYVFLGTVAIFLGIGFLIFSLGFSGHERKITLNPSEVNILRELSHWRVLFKCVWPAVALSTTLSLIDATFWTTGAVWTESLGRESWWGGFILPAYQLPSLFIGLLIAKWKIYTGKKKIGERFLALSGLALIFLAFDAPVFVFVLIVFVSSSFMGISYPLVEAVYSDITARMGVERKHLIGLSASTISLAYIVGPVLAGSIASLVGEKNTFVVIGVLTMVISLVLLAVTPRKLRLPKAEIVTWRN